jgi:thiol-disulfide isomerase/thioredoxin
MLRKAIFLAMLVPAWPVCAQPIPSKFLVGDLRSLRVHKTPVPLPPLSFQDDQGRDVSVASFQGRIVVINLWATWCAPCIRELPSLSALKKAVTEDGVVVLAVSQDAGGNKIVPPFLKKLKLQDLPALFDNEQSFTKHLRVPVLPTTLIVDKEGREIGRLVGAADWNSTDVKHLLRHLSRSP